MGLQELKVVEMMGQLCGGRVGMRFQAEVKVVQKVLS